jgi:uncharacterized protein YdeI (YjbR/CyaY-like superfamily)
MSRAAAKKEQVLAFSTQKLWRVWLLKHHAKSKGVQLRVFKKGTGVKSVNYDQALDEALCFGWIDGQKNKYDERSWLQRFTPRRPRSLWSKRNREHVARLIKAKQMMPAGLEEVKRAKKDGRWERAYDAPKDMKVPEDFLKALRQDAQAHQFFKTLNKANVYAIAWRLQLAKKPETRERWKAKFLELMRSGTRIH